MSEPPGATVALADAPPADEQSKPLPAQRVLPMFGTAQSMGSTHPGDIVPLLLVATAWYLILTSVVPVTQFYVERHYARGATRSLPPTPLQKLRTGLTDLRARITVRLHESIGFTLRRRTVFALVRKNGARFPEETAQPCRWPC